MNDTSAATDWRFFRWTRGMDVPRRAGWIGGVCAGIADRIRIDPIIVRGIAVVLTVLGAPALLLYAAAWLLLPDTDDRIHLERLLRGRFDPAIVGAGVMMLLQLTPLTAGFWFLGYSYWSEPYGGAGWFFRVLWTGFMLVAVVLFILWMARRARASEQRAAFAASSGADAGTGTGTGTGTGGADAHAASAAWVASPSGTVASGAEGMGGSDAGGAPFATAGSSAADSSTAGSPTTPPGAPADAGTATRPGDAGAPAAASARPPLPGEPVAPAPPAADAPAEQLAAWRQQQESWKLHHAAWAAQQRGGADAAIRRELAMQRAAERERQHAEWRERQRRRRAANPRAGFLATVLALGAALLAAGAVVLGVRSAGLPEVQLAAGLATVAAVFGLAMIVAGAARRRSGFLAFLAVVSLVAATLAAAVPLDRTLLWGQSLDLRQEGASVSLLGDQYAYFNDDWIDGVAVDASGEPLVSGSRGTAEIDLIVRDGDLVIELPTNLTVELDLQVSDGTAEINRRWYGDGRFEELELDGDRLSTIIGPGETPDAHLVGSVNGTVYIRVQDGFFEEQRPTPSPSTTAPATDESQTEEVQP